MCYDVNYIYKQQLKRAKYHDDKKAIEEISDTIEEHFPKQVYYVSGFSHPDMIIYTQDDPYMPKLSNWGLVPFWCKEAGQADKLRNMCLNAVGETMFEKPSFREAAKSKRGIVYLNGFYEHHHQGKKTYPHFIYNKNNEPIPVGILYDEWADIDTGELQHTFAIVTAPANNMMSKIHNTKKRMPLILPDDLVEDWLKPINDKVDKELIQEIVKPYPDGILSAHTIGRIKGKNAIGNIELVTNPVKYKELDLVL